MRKAPPSGNSPPLGLSREGQPSREASYIFTLLGEMPASQTWLWQENKWKPVGGGALKQCGLIQRTVIMIIFKALFIWEWKDRDFIGLKFQKLGCFQPPLWCFSGTHMECCVVAASGKEGAALHPGYVLSPCMIYWADMALENCNSASPLLMIQGGRHALGFQGCVYLHVCTHALSWVVHLGTPLPNGFTGIFSVLEERLIRCSKHRGVKLDFRGVGRGQCWQPGRIK